MEIREKMRQVPFGNSAFQIQHIIANEHTAERAYRTVLLQYDSKMKALKECSFRRKRVEVDIEEINEKMKSASGFDAKRLEIDLEEKAYALEAELKLIEDCMIELKVYEDIINGLPEFTRKDFERAELEYWKTRLLHDAELEYNSTGVIGVGTLQSLDKIGVKFRRSISGNDVGKFICFEDESVKKIEQ